MVWWVTLLLFVGSIIISEALKPKPQFQNAPPAGLGEFNFPTAQEGRPLPVVWGTVKLRGPNVLWYGNLTTVPIIEIVKYKKMFKTKKKRVIKGHRYFVDMHMGLCHGPIDAIPAVFIQDRSAFGLGVGPVGPVTSVINLPDFFGGSEKGGGLGGQVLTFQGNDTDAVSSVIDAAIGQSPTPGFRRIANVFLKRFEIGNDQFIEPWNFVIRRIPTALGSTTPTIVNDQGNSDANPAEVIFELLTEHSWGSNIGPAQIDIVNFKAVADTLATEGFGVSLIWDNKKPVEDMIIDILRQIDGVLFNDIVTGLFTLKLARDDFDVSLIPVLDQSNISSLDTFSRGALDETINEVKIVYTGRNFNEANAQAHELANFNTQGESKISSSLRYPGINDSGIAADVAFRELRGLSFPLARIRVKVTREAFNLRPGDTFKFTWPPLGLADLVMRVGDVGYGTLDQGFITIDATQDIFTLGNTIWADPQPTDWIEPVNDPAPAPFEDAFSTPFQIVRDEFQTEGWNTEEANAVATVASEPSSDTLGYSVLTNQGGGFITTGSTDDITPTGTLLNDYDLDEDNCHLDTTDTLVVTDSDTRMALIVAATTPEVLEGYFNLAFIGDIDTQEGEIIAFEDIVDNGDGTFNINTVFRGLMDTTPKDHPAGTRIWFTFYGMGTSELEFGDTEAITLKYLMRTPNGTLDVGSAATIAHTFTSRAQRPYPPGNFLIEGDACPEFNDGDLGVTSEVNLTWAHRDRQIQLDLVNQGDGNLGPEADVDYQLRIHDEDDVLIKTEDFSPGSGTTSFDYECLVEAADSSIAVDVINNIALRWPGGGSTNVFAANSTTLNSDGAGYDEKTIEVKLRTSSNITTRQIIWEQGDHLDGLNMYIDAGGLRAGVWSDGATTPFSEFTSSIAILPNTKYNFAFVFDNPNSRIRLYINGILVDDNTGLTLDTLVAHSGTFNEPTLGRKSRTRFHDGNDTGGGSILLVDTLAFEARQWNEARTTTEIDTNQNANLVGTETNLVLLWEISDGTGTTVTDETANGNDGTRSGSPLPEWVCPDLVLNETLRFELDSRFLASGLLSHQFQDRTMTRAGWGYGWGETWGGAA